MKRGQKLALTGATAALAGGLVVIPTATASTQSPETSDTDNSRATTSAETELATATRKDLTEQVEVKGALGFGETTTLPITASGLVTDRAKDGAIINPGDELIRVDNRPVTLADGSVPLYRELRRVLSDERDDNGLRIGAMTGADVEQLQRFLIDAGFTAGDRLEVDGTFGVMTERAVKEWQKSIGHPQTGRVDRSQMIFTPGPVRLASTQDVGQEFSELSVTNGTPQVTATVTSRQRSFFEVGTSVEVDIDGARSSAEVKSQTRVVGEDGSTRFTIAIEIPEAVDLTNEASVKVFATKTVASDVITLPVRALIALAEGGWAVQVSTPQGPQLTAVELGSIVDGMAEITGVEDGAEVVVPL